MLSGHPRTALYWIACSRCYPRRLDYGQTYFRPGARQYALNRSAPRGSHRHRRIAVFRNSVCNGLCLDRALNGALPQAQQRARTGLLSGSRDQNGDNIGGT